MTDRKQPPPPLPPTINPRYNGADMGDLARAVMRPADPRARETLLQKQTTRAR